MLDHLSRRPFPTVGRRCLVALAFVILFLGSGSLAGAQSNTTLVIRRVDATDPKNLKLDFIWTGPQSDLAGLKLVQNDQDTALTTPAAPLKVAQGVVFVLDSGPAMDKDGALVSAREGAIKFVSAHPEIQFGVVQAGDKADLKLGLSTDTQKIISAINSVGPTKGTAAWGALTIAGTTLKERPELQPNIMMIVGDEDNVAPQNQPIGRTAVNSSGSSLFLVERQGFMDAAPYEALVSRAGGAVFATDQAPKLGEITGQAGNAIATQQFQLTYNSNLGRQQVADVKLTVGGQTSTASFLPGSVYTGGEALRPDVGSRGGPLPLLDNQAVLFIALLLALVAVAGSAYALSTTFIRDDLSDVLMPYSDSYGVEEAEGSAIQKSALIQRAVALTEQVAENQGFLTRAEGALERANMPLRAGEAMFFYLIIVIVVTLLGLLRTRNFVAGLMFGGIAAMIPIAVVSRRAKKRRKKFLGQLPDTLSLLAGTLKAGYSLMQGVEAVAQEVEDPMGIELRRVVTEARLGRPLEDSLEASALRMDSPDFAWAVMAIGIQREVGGNLSELLMTVADTMVQRERLRRDIQSLTAEGRISALVLSALPVILGLVMYVLNPEYMGTLFTDGLGIGMLIVAGVSMLIGFLWMKKIITIEI